MMEIMEFNDILISRWSSVLELLMFGRPLVNSMPMVQTMKVHYIVVSDKVVLNMRTIGIFLQIVFLPIARKMNVN